MMMKSKMVSLYISWPTRVSQHCGQRHGHNTWINKSAANSHLTGSSKIHRYCLKRNDLSTPGARFFIKGSLKKRHRNSFTAPTAAQLQEVIMLWAALLPVTIEMLTAMSYYRKSLSIAAIEETTHWVKLMVVAADTRLLLASGDLRPKREEQHSNAGQAHENTPAKTGMRKKK